MQRVVRSAARAMLVTRRCARRAPRAMARLRAQRCALDIFLAAGYFSPRRRAFAAARFFAAMPRH